MSAPLLRTGPVDPRTVARSAFELGGAVSGGVLPLTGRQEASPLPNDVAAAPDGVRCDEVMVGTGVEGGVIPLTGRRASWCPPSAHRRRSRLVALVALVAVCAGCGSTPEAEPAQTPSAVVTLGPSDVELEDPDALVDLGAVEVTPQDPGPDAGCFAQSVMNAWARPDLPHDQWWAGLSDLLTAGAQEIVVETDPALIPVTSATAVDLVDAGSPYLAWVSFDSGADTWWVLLAWQPDGRWLADRITQTGPVDAAVIGPAVCA